MGFLVLGFMLHYLGMRFVVYDAGFKSCDLMLQCLGMRLRIHEIMIHFRSLALKREDQIVKLSGRMPQYTKALARLGKKIMNFRRGCDA